MLGDLSLIFGDIFNNKYLNETLLIYQMAAQASVETKFEKDPELTEYFITLRRELVEQYGVVLVSLGEPIESNKHLQSIFLNYAPQLFAFLH